MREFCTTGDLRLSFTARASGCGGRRPARTCHGTVRQHVMTAERYAGLVWCGTACMVQKGCRILCSWQGACERSPLSTSAIDHTSARPGCSYKIPDVLRRPARRLGSDEAGQDCRASEQSALPIYVPSGSRVVFIFSLTFELPGHPPTTTRGTIG